MTKQEYSNKLKSPKWQKRRTEILNLKGFKCELCGEEDKQIHVHHRFYIDGRDPWEYDNDVFQVLCESCHTEVHSAQRMPIQEKEEQEFYVSENGGFIDVYELVKLKPHFENFFLHIGNHKGIWEVAFKNDVDLPTQLFLLYELSQHIKWVDGEIYLSTEKTYPQTNMFEFFRFDEQEEKFYHQQIRKYCRL